MMHNDYLHPNYFCKLPYFTTPWKYWIAKVDNTKKNFDKKIPTIIWKGENKNVRTSVDLKWTQIIVYRK